MADNIAFAENNVAYALHTRQKRNGFGKAGFLSRRQVGLRRIATDDHARTLADSGQKHFHLHAGGVLRLIEKHGGIGKGAPAHESQRCHFDHAGLQPALDHARIHEIMQGIIDRSQIGIDFFAHVAGQKAKPLAGLDRRARQDEALNKALLQQRHRMANSQPGFAGAGWPLGKHQFIVAQLAEINILRRVAGPDSAALARGNLLETGADWFGVLREQVTLQRALLDRAIDIAH